MSSKAKSEDSRCVKKQRALNKENVTKSGETGGPNDLHLIVKEPKAGECVTVCYKTAKAVIHLDNGYQTAPWVLITVFITSSNDRTYYR